MSAPPSRVGRLSARVAAVVLLVFGFLPIANWIPGGRDWPRYHGDLESWISGSAIALGAGVLYYLVSRRSERLWRDGALDPLVRRWASRPRLATAILVYAPKPRRTTLQAAGLGLLLVLLAAATVARTVALA